MTPEAKVELPESAETVLFAMLVEKSDMRLVERNRGRWARDPPERYSVCLREKERKKGEEKGKASYESVVL